MKPSGPIKPKAAMRLLNIVSKKLLFLALCLKGVTFTSAFGVERRAVGMTARILRGDRRIRTELHADRDDNSNMDSMRKALESAWNFETMGAVPTDPESAAEAAAVSVRNALDQNVLSMVDILLPQYDASQGEKLYDEVLAVEFCVALANKLKTKTSIVVRDDKTIKTVSRILDRREENEASMENNDPDEEGDSVGDYDGKYDDDDKDNDIEVFDDFADIGLIGDTPKEEVDSFRAKLAVEWNKDESATPRKLSAYEKSKLRPPPSAASPMSAASKPKGTKPRQFRLCSMLGEAVGMRAGPDMQGKVIEALKANALPKEDEEAIIILSAASPQELVGIRALVGQYQNTKKMILVNCRVTPLPRELARAQTVYSILPLIAKPVEDKQSTPKKDDSPPRVVVLRRFPRDWEVFVDKGNGFELAATVPATSTLQKGPSLQWVGDAVKRYLGASLR
eukprot:scaffold9735_cov174-Amphora_coffeaeformis.AAC.7